VDSLHKWRGRFVGAGAALAGALAALQQIQDNSALVHIRTGFEITRDWSIPKTDPYSFTARGADWTVQSWIPSTLYGLAVRATNNNGGLLLINLVLCVLIALGLSQLARNLPLRESVVAMIGALAVVLTQYSPRPLLFGVLCFVWLAVVVYRNKRTWLIVPIFWVWANSHGSWPIGVAWLVVICGVALFSETPLLVRRLRVLGLAALGVACAAIGPLGWRVWTFPLISLQKSEIFSQIIEWQAPDWRGQGGVALGAVCLLLVLMVHQKVTLWHSIVAVGFVAAGLYAARNLIFVPVPVLFALACGSSPSVDRSDEVSGLKVPRISEKGFRFGVRAASVLIFLLAGFAVMSNALQLKSYPITEVEALKRANRIGDDNRVMAPDWVGCYLVFQLGNSANVFIDDRYDMYPLQVARDYRTIRLGRPGALALLDDYQIETVVWQSKEPFVAQLQLSDDWEQQPALAESDWLVFYRR